MLQIRLNKSFFLELPEKLSLSVVDENPIFLSDRIPIAHTLNFEIDKTPNNLFYLGYPDRPSSKSIFNRHHAEIIHFGSVILVGELICISTADTINLQFINAILPKSLKKPMREIDFGSKDFGTMFTNLELINADYNHPMYDEFKTAVLNSVFNKTSDEFITSPVRTLNNEWDGHPAAWGLKNAINMYINYFNPINQNWTMPDAINNPQPGLVTRHTAKCIFPIIPFPYVHMLIGHILSDTLVNNVFYDDPDLRKLVMVCFNHKNFIIDNIYDLYQSVFLFNFTYTHIAFPISDALDKTSFTCPHQWKYNSFMQNYPFNEFFKSLLTTFGITAFVNDKIELVFNNQLFDEAEIFDISPFVSSVENCVENKKRYRLNYGTSTVSQTTEVIPDFWAPTIIDAYTQVNIPNQPKSFRIGTHPNLILELTMKAVGIPQSGQSQKFIIESEIKTSELATNVFNQETTEEDIDFYDVNIAVTPLEMNIEHYWNELFNEEEEYINRYHWHVPVIKKGDLSTPPYIMLDAGLTHSFDSQEHIYRYITNHHTDAFGNKLLNLSLLINKTDPDGIYIKYHKKIADWYEKDKIKLILKAIMTPFQLRAITNKHKIHYSGRNFFILKREYEISDKRFIEVTFTLIEC